MPRPHRPLLKGGWYHVTNRGVDRMDIYRTNGDRQRFLELVAQATSTHKLEVHAYCLMNNHYHLLVRTPEGNLDAAMHRAMSIYAREFNARHHRDGPLFKARYHACLVDTDAYLLAVSRYIHRNPIDLGIADFDAYRWSSYSAYVGRRRVPKWLTTRFTLRHFQSRGEYQRFVEVPFDNEVDRLLRSAKPPRAIGPHVTTDDLAA